MSENMRQQRMIERIQEDERLRGDLEDPAAAALVEWATQRVRAATADPERPDAEVEACVLAIRAAARAAAHADATDAAGVIAHAEAALARTSNPGPAPAVPAEAPLVDAPLPPPPVATLHRSGQGSLPAQRRRCWHRRLARWLSRLRERTANGATTDNQAPDET